MNPPFELFYNFDPTDPSRYHNRTVDAEYFDWLLGMLADTGMTLLFRALLMVLHPREERAEHSL